MTDLGFLQSAGNDKSRHIEFMDDTRNIVFVGGPGIGKTHLATAIGVQAIKYHRHRVCLFVHNRTGQSAETGKAGRSPVKAGQLAHAHGSGRAR